jgi:hypothetical protein
MELKDTDKPFHVRCDESFVSGHDTEEGAKADAKRRNEQARELLLSPSVEYIVSAKEES